MDLKQLSRHLEIADIDFRVQSVNKAGGLTILAYKDARVDMNRLDEVCTPLGWKREHSRDNHNCTVSLWCDDKKEWIGKEDTGTESNVDQQKGLASDSFKRACFNIGIGRELYDYPRIFIWLDSDYWEEYEYEGKKKARTNFKFNDYFSQWRWTAKFDGNRIVYLSAMHGQACAFEWSIEDDLDFETITLCYSEDNQDGVKAFWDDIKTNRPRATALWDLMGKSQEGRNIRAIINGKPNKVDRDD